MKNHKHYQTAYNAHAGTSHVPDRRANDECAGFDNLIKNLQELGISDDKILKFENLWVKWMNAKSRCLSSMITGPANFPVRRNEKANNSERNAADACLDYYNKIIDYKKTENFYAENPLAKPVMIGDDDAVERLKEKLNIAKQNQEKMKAVNAIVRKLPIDREKLLELLGTDDAVNNILKSNHVHGQGFATYCLNNNRAEIKRLEGRVQEIENRKATTPKDLIINGVRLLENTEMMRLQLFFEGKPERAIIDLLKKNAFKWSPTNSAWQRQLTNNAIWAVNNNIIPVLKTV